MGLIASLRRSRTEPMVESTAAPAASKPAKKEDDYRQRKLTRLMNPFQITIKRTTLPSSLQQFMKEPAGSEEKKVDFFADNSATSMTLHSDELCFICNVYSTSEDLFTCRVCMKSFHEGCLQKIGNLSSEVSHLRASAISKSIFGWSCYKCSNLSLLLMEDEMHEIMELFDDYDSNQDTQISLDEYVKFREMQYTSKTKTEFPNDMKALAEDEFQMIDRDGTGTIDWWEFLNHEAVKMLRKREKKDLVRILSQKEIADAKEKFDALDVDNDGKVTAFEAEKVFNDWFCKLTMSGKNLNGRKSNFPRSPKSKSRIANHAHNHAMLVMEADSDANKYVDWEEYLENEAICIIATRPNIPMPSLQRNKHARVEQS